MKMPCMILRGCLRGEKVIEFIQRNLPEMYDSSKRIVELTMSKGRPVKVYRWSWGVEIGCHAYRSKSTAWWDELLGMFGSTSETPEIVILYNVDSLGADNQRVVRRHVEDDYKKVRYILTCSNYAILDPSLESRCSTLKMNSKVPDLPEITCYKDAEELWLADVHANEILNAIFKQALAKISPSNKTKSKRNSIVQKWCWYSDILKSCYQELTVIEAVFQDLNAEELDTENGDEDERKIRSKSKKSVGDTGSKRRRKRGGDTESISFKGSSITS